MISSPILNIAKKEILDNVRNKWVIILTIIFASLTLVVSYFGSIFSPPAVHKWEFQYPSVSEHPSAPPR